MGGGERSPGALGDPHSHPDTPPAMCPQLSQGITTLCATPRDTWRDPQGCCSQGHPEQRHCFNTKYLARVTLGAAVAPPPLGHDE